MLTTLQKIQLVTLLAVSLLGTVAVLAQAPEAAEPPPAPEAVKAEPGVPICAQEAGDDLGLGEAVVIPPVPEPQPATNCCADLCRAECGSEPCLCSRRLCQVLACGV